MWSSLACRRPPEGFGSSRPLVPAAFTSFTTKDTDTSKWLAAARREWPASTNPATRSRKSREYGFGMANHLLTEVNHKPNPTGIPPDST